MKTFPVIVVTAVVTWAAAGLFYGIKSATERLWLISAIKAPGRMALEEIQKELKLGRCDVAQAKVEIFLESWRRFNSGPDSFRGRGIGDILVEFSQAETNAGPVPLQPAGKPEAR